MCPKLSLLHLSSGLIKVKNIHIGSVFCVSKSLEELPKNYRTCLGVFFLHSNDINFDNLSIGIKILYESNIVPAKRM